MAQGCQQRIKFIDSAFKQLHMLFLDIGLGQVKASDISHHAHQQLLYVKNGFLNILASSLCTCQTQSGGDFVHSAISLYAQGLLGYAFAGVEASGALVAGTSVNSSFFHINHPFVNQKYVRVIV